MLREPLLNKRLVEKRLAIEPIPQTHAEAQLDAEVYALFGLTEPEIALLESGLARRE